LGGRYDANPAPPQVEIQPGWQSQFGDEPAILGRTVTRDEQPPTTAILAALAIVTGIVPAIRLMRFNIQEILRQ
jgi:hypothetical protein